MTAIVAVDPGPHAGVAVCSHYHLGAPYHFDTLLFHEEAPEVWKFVRDLEPEAIVIERFQAYASHGMQFDANGLATMEMQGGLEEIASHLGCELVLQTAVQRMPFLPIAKKLLNAGSSKIETHEVDALAHLLRYIQLTSRNKASGITLPHQLFGEQP